MDTEDKWQFFLFAWSERDLNETKTLDNLQILCGQLFRLIKVAGLGRDGLAGEVPHFVEGLKSLAWFCQNGLLDGTKLPRESFLDLGNEP